MDTLILTISGIIFLVSGIALQLGYNQISMFDINHEIYPTWMKVVGGVTFVNLVVLMTSYGIWIW